MLLEGSFTPALMGSPNPQTAQIALCPIALVHMCWKKVGQIGQHSVLQCTAMHRDNGVTTLIVKKRNPNIVICFTMHHSTHAHYTLEGAP